jgi:uncharacterized HAD superfamily protein
MNLKQVFNIQKSFNKKFFGDKNLDIESLSIENKIKYSKDFVLYVMKESSEILQNIKYKDYCDEDIKYIEYNLVENLVDIFKFVLCVCNVHNIEYDKFEKVLIDKSEVVKQRYIQDSNLLKIKNSNKVVAFDLDGVIADYHSFFLSYINKKSNSNFKDLFEAKKSLNENTFKMIKDLYRQSGEKLNLKLKKGSKKIIDYYKDNNYKIVIITARPYHRYSRIYSDTLHWLKKHKINFDYIFWTSEKSIKIIKSIKKMKFIVEDTLENANNISKMGYNVYLINNKYNLGECEKNVVRIKNLEEIFKYEIH